MNIFLKKKNKIRRVSKIKQNIEKMECKLSFVNNPHEN